MTQDYEPIKLTESTPEPKENGIYLLTITLKSETETMPLYKDGNVYFGADSAYSWGEMVKELSMADEVTIQSLAAYGAQIRAKAWGEGYRTAIDDLNNPDCFSGTANPYMEVQQ